MNRLKVLSPYANMLDESATSVALVDDGGDGVKVVVWHDGFWWHILSIDEDGIHLDGSVGYDCFPFPILRGNNSEIMVFDSEGKPLNSLEINELSHDKTERDV